MRIALLAVMTALMILPGCGKIREFRFNPFNWSRAEVTTLEPKDGYDLTPEYRALVDQVLTLAVEPMPGGAIVRATGLPATQGYWQADLVPENDGEPVDGVLTLRFLVFPPPEPTPSSTQPSREITVGLFLTDQQLARISRITVQGQQTALSVRR